MIYHGGDIIPGKVTINLILYGDWSVFKVGNDAQEIITNFVENLGTSSYWRTATGYYDTDDFVKANIVLGGVFYDRFSTGFGTSLDYAALPAIVQNAIQTGFGGVADYNALYVVITDPDVTNSYGFCSEFCAYHTFYSDGDQAVKYTFVGNPATQCYYSCAPQDDPSQPTANGNPGIDALTSSLAHEIAEAITDPKPFTTWYDQNRLEIADKCAYNYILDPLPTVANGGQYNVALGNRRYLLQGLWVNDLGGYCDILPTY
ncbi:hypothetical protein WJX72_007703 [[Myrmecia] bisecta]|uniref:Uncharacterized protein n=1 Tax=[Myrmecia] bisecta TaxID=41462 RepID=A0AAW1R800_9CHLO